MSKDDDTKENKEIQNSSKELPETEDQSSDKSLQPDKKSISVSQSSLSVRKKRRRILRDRELSFKTFIISHLSILTAGLLFLGSIYYILHFENNPLSLENYNPVTKQSISFDLEVNSPEDNSLVFEPNIVVSGKTGPRSTIIIKDNDKNIGLEANENGAFTKIVTLSTGVNYLTVAAFDPNGNIKTKTVTIYYSQDKLEQESKVEESDK